MGRKNRIQIEVPAELRAELDAQIADGRKSIDQLQAFLAANGHDDISRSGVARYVLSQEEVIANIRQSREMANAISMQLGPDDGDGSTNAQLTEMAQVILHRGMMKLITDPDADVSPGDMGKIAKALQAAASAQKLDVDRRINAAKLQAAQAAARETAGKAAEAAVAAVGKGVSKQTVEAIRTAVLGVAP
ncbi:hypothetical protein sos41_31420 [Alphaproteobacteria bacterium SO-S41]|nr:hypothetical protein sos41_31420 [Alphaproteobacteria bacterium SO-S41]